MWIHKHPFSPFIPKNTTKLIVGTIPPPRFSNELMPLKDNDVNFSYGAFNPIKNYKCLSLWGILDNIFALNLAYENTSLAIEQRKKFLKEYQIGICDLVVSCEREDTNASDFGMKNIKLRNILQFLENYPSITTLIFIGGNSVNGPEYLFRKLLKQNNVKLEKSDLQPPKRHFFLWNNKKYITYTLISSSPSANKSIGAIRYYKDKKIADPNFNTFLYRKMLYKKVFGIEKN